jgi:glucose-1-phosphate adenylyltransferase
VKGEIGDRPAAYFNPGAVVKNSLVSRDCIIKGTVTNSILSPGVVIGRGSVVEDSVIFHDVVIGKNCVIKQAIVDKNVTFGDSIRIGEGELVPNRKTPEQLSSGISVIGKGTRIGSQITIGKSCIIGPDNVITSKKFKAIRSGTTI